MALNNEVVQIYRVRGEQRAELADYSSFAGRHEACDYYSLFHCCNYNPP
jgi:hypothetical protein